MEIAFHRCGDLHKAEAHWRALEPDAHCSFFTSATWMFCQAQRRFPDPFLLRIGPTDRPDLLALFNRRRRRFVADAFWMSESGDKALDAVFIEHNAPLTRTATTVGLGAGLAEVLRASGLAGRVLGRRVFLSGIGADVAATFRVRGISTHVRAERPSPRIDFGALDGDFIASVSANTRSQLRRSDRLYERRGPLRVARAEDLATARAWLAELAALHQSAWRARGQSGAFTNPAFTAFHDELLTRGCPRDEIDILRVTAGSHVVGLLYSFRFRGRVYAYQSGFAYEATSPQLKPGLTSHHLAIEYYRQQGAISYDFLAGESRYKTSLANRTDHLVWLEMTHASSPRAVARKLRNAARQVLKPCRFTRR